MIEDQEVTAKEKYNFLNLLASLYTKRIQLLIGSDPKEYLNLTHYINEVKHKEKYGASSINDNYDNDKKEASYDINPPTIRGENEQNEKQLFI